VFAEFETNLRRERQLEGIAKAKAAGVYKGRPASIAGVRLLRPGPRCARQFCLWVESECDAVAAG
jgi:DNA invertase Pin-like site-specific DNA recombinase